MNLTTQQKRTFVEIAIKKYDESNSKEYAAEKLAHFLTDTYGGKPDDNLRISLLLVDRLEHMRATKEAA